MFLILKNITCIILTLILFLHINFVGLYYSLYSLNKTELIEAVCEKQKICCEAKCYLDKKINEENSNDTNGTANKEIKLKISEFIVSGKTILTYPKKSLDQYLNNSQNTSSGFPQENFEPPKS